VSVFRLVLGLAFLALGLVSVLGRDRIVARHRARGKAHPQPPMLWLVLGGLYLLIGVFWLVTAFV
jgi:hypothetical protein